MHTTNFLLLPSLDSEGPKHSLQILARLAGIEPTTPWFVAKYSIQLSYSRLRSRIISHEFRFGKLTFYSTFLGETGVSGSFLRSILCKEAELYAGVSHLSSIATQFLLLPSGHHYFIHETYFSHHESKLDLYAAMQHHSPVSSILLQENRIQAR